MSTVEQVLEPILQGLQILPSGLCWTASIPGFLPNLTLPKPNQEDAISDFLYWRCFTRPAGEGSGEPTRDMTAELEMAAPEPYSPDPGWEVKWMGQDNRFAVSKNGRQRLVRAGDIVQPEAPVGGVVSLRRNVCSRTQQAGFFYYFGATLASEFDRRNTVRFYCNTAPEHAVENCEKIVRHLNRYQVPFILKVLSRTSAFDRADSSVLYVPRRYSRIVSICLRECDLSLRNRSPLFTRHLMPGAGVADDPITGESFGQTRCRLTARGYLDSVLQGGSCMGQVRRSFERAGLDWSRPWLGPGNAEFELDDGNLNEC